MIKLNIRVSHSFASDQSLALRIRLSDLAGKPATDTDGLFYKTETGDSVIDTTHGSLVLKDNTTRLEEGEVIFFYPNQSVVRRFYRPSANSNTILLTEECDQLCVMCSQPPKNKRYDQYELYAAAIRLVPQNAVIGITGGEPTLLKDELFVFLSSMLEERPDLFFHILSNAQHLTENDRPVLTKMQNNILWGIPIYSSDSEIHDQIVGKTGAFDKLIEGLNHLFSAGAQVELRTVLMRQNVTNLSELAEFVSTHLPWIEIWAIMQLENIGYARMNWDHIFFDNSVEFTPIQRGLTVASARNINVALYNFPLCTVPETYRGYARASISDWKKKYFNFCSDCVDKLDCCGVFEWHTEKRGFAKLTPVIQ